MPTYQENTGKTIQQAFEAFHKSHPGVYVYFKKLARANIQKFQKDNGKSENYRIRMSAKEIINRLRWEMKWGDMTSITMKTKAKKKARQVDQSEMNVLEDNFKDFKINDAFHSRYARLWQEEKPTWAHIFNTRILRSA